MADIEIHLTHRSDGLYFKTPQMMDFEKMNETSVVAADPGNSIAWICNDDTIRKILNIKVNKAKSGSRNWKDIWSDKPKKADNTGRVFQGMVHHDPVSSEDPQFNGYDIHYLSQDGNEKKVDPEIKIPVN
jgi:hypothetical protein